MEASISIINLKQYLVFIPPLIFCKEIHVYQETAVLHEMNFTNTLYHRFRAIMILIDSQKDNLEVLDLDGAELSDDSMEKISTCPRLKKLGVSFAELLTGKSLRFLRVNNTSNVL